MSLLENKKPEQRLMTEDSIENDPYAIFERAAETLWERTELALEKGEVARISDNRISFIDIKLLVHSRSVKDQSALNSKQRVSNVSGALVVPSKFKSRIGGGNIGPLIIVDDLITTDPGTGIENINLKVIWLPENL